MSLDVLVQLESGREFRLTLSPNSVEELKQSEKVGRRRVFIIGEVPYIPEDIPWGKMFPGVSFKKATKHIAVLPTELAAEMRAMCPPSLVRHSRAHQL